ncbi:Arabinose metabolism transcriptional repressor [Chlamydia abortus]|nr:Arabinose metabolism transcriptional repressor [Chlamydia abortus]
MLSDQDSKPMYEKIFEILVQDIRNGKYRRGQRIPSEMELAEKYNVSRITSRKSLEMIASQGLIARKPGKGSFVVDAMEQTPDDQASSYMPVRRTDVPVLGLIMTDFGESYGIDLLRGIESAAEQHGAFLLLRRSFGKPEREERAIREFTELGANGFIIFPGHGRYINTEILKLVINKIPLVLIDRYLKGVEAASVSTDHAAAAREGAKHLLEWGHRRIGLLSPPPVDTSATEERMEGFVQAHAEQGVAIEKNYWLNDITSTLPGSFTKENIERDIDKIKNHLQQHPDMTAIFATEYNIALLAKAAIGQLGLTVPGDISVVCFDCPPSNPGSGYWFTHLLQQQEEMGRRAVETVLKLRKGEPVDMTVRLAARLVQGESTAAANKK